MGLRGILLGVALLLLAVSGVFFFRAWLIAQRNQPATATAAAPAAPAAPPTMVLVANVEVPAGTFLKDEMLRWQSWPNNSLDPNYLIQGKIDQKSLSGAVARRGIAAGEPITEGRIVHPGDRGFIAAVLRPGMRAVSFGINETSAIAGLVYPGDRVDLILTHSVGPTPVDPTAGHRASETLLENVRILAIDQALGHVPGQPSPVGRTATIEVSPKQAEIMSVAVDLGRISLALRSLANPPNELTGAADAIDIPDPDRGKTFTFDNDVSNIVAPPPPPPKPQPVKRAFAPQGTTIELNRGGKVEQLLVN
jgi:pilus assembly protein CpaB